MSSKRVLIAGYGYLGSVLANHLKQEGYYTIGLKRKPINKYHADELITCDLYDSPLPNTLGKLDAVYYMISADRFDPLSYQKAYVICQQRLAQTLMKQSGLPKRWFFISSTRVYPPTQEYVDHLTPAKAHDFASQALLNGESVANTLPCQSTIVRPSGIYGLGRMTMLKAIKQGKIPPLYASNAWANRIACEDLAHLLRWLLTHDINDHTILASDNNPMRYIDILDGLIDTLHLDRPEIDLTKKRMKTSQKRIVSTRLRDLGFEFIYPNFLDGMRHLLRQHGPN